VVKKGDRVEAGEPIGLVGDTGRSFGGCLASHRRLHRSLFRTPSPVSGRAGLLCFAAVKPLFRVSSRP
jgi:murein DD-endopeptidase MepM/ murein hydrolase activator NlpD